MKRAFPIGLIILGLLLSLGAARWMFFSRPADSADPQSVPLPASLASLRMTAATRGAEAITAFENLHGRQFPITSGAIGVYGNQEITVWVAGTESSALAAQMVEAMRVKIAEGNSPFTPLTTITRGDRVVYVLDGMGQRHYYFQSSNLVVWLAAAPSIAGQALQQILEVYP